MHPHCNELHKTRVEGPYPQYCRNLERIFVFNSPRLATNMRGVPVLSNIWNHQDRGGSSDTSDVQSDHTDCRKYAQVSA